MHTALTDLGHDVLSALDRDPRAADEALLALANKEQRVLITEDKDFGELVFVRGCRIRASSGSSTCRLRRR